MQPMQAVGVDRHAPGLARGFPSRDRARRRAAAGCPAAASRRIGGEGGKRGAADRVAALHRLVVLGGQQRNCAPVGVRVTPAPGVQPAAGAAAERRRRRAPAPATVAGAAVAEGQRHRALGMARRDPDRRVELAAAGRDPHRRRPLSSPRADASPGRSARRCPRPVWSAAAAVPAASPTGARARRAARDRGRSAARVPVPRAAGSRTALAVQRAPRPAAPRCPSIVPALQRLGQAAVVEPVVACTSIARSSGRNVPSSQRQQTAAWAAAA